MSKKTTVLIGATDNLTTEERWFGVTLHCRNQYSDLEVEIPYYNMQKIIDLLTKALENENGPKRYPGF